jgi:DNA replication licensing factor MCM7
MLAEVALRRRRIVSVSLDDLMAFEGDETFVVHVERNTRRYVSLVSDAIDDLLPAFRQGGQEDAFDVIRSERIRQHIASAREQGIDPDTSNVFPPELMRRYEVHIEPRATTPELAIREVGARQIGRLVKVRGMVTRVTDVKPLMSVATYTCDVCGFEIYQEVKARKFMPLSECPSEMCVSNRVRGKLYMQTRGSKFVKFQTCRIQELPDQVPIGHIPRSMTVHLRGERTRSVLPGDQVTISGLFLPTPYTGYRAVRAGLTADTYLEAMHVRSHKQSYEQMQCASNNAQSVSGGQSGGDGDALSEEIEALVDAAVEDEEIYTKLAKSIAPEIFGLVDIKKALLLQLVGGVTKKLSDGMKIRGDINICMMGDPGVAKSQLLKHVAKIAPRCVYTTGKGSSGVGLTAAVQKDTVSGEMVLEGGALVLADKGICCIDEFDKMEEGDRTAIHEVMEQQTVSIAKGGITTTLNARTAILAAANPLMGRYNRKKSPSANINLPAALLSRFDLMFLMLDRPDAEKDRQLANHIAYVHRCSRHPDLTFEPLSPRFIRAYVAQARRVEPFIPKELSAYVVEEYVNMRQRDAADAKREGEAALMTARQLLSILRLAQALARLQFAQKVAEEDVDEAIRLVHTCRAQLREDESVDGAPGAQDATSSIYLAILDHIRSAGGSSRTIRFSRVEPLLLAKGYRQEEIRKTIEQYEELDVFRLNASRTRITLVTAQ